VSLWQRYAVWITSSYNAKAIYRTILLLGTLAAVITGLLTMDGVAFLRSLFIGLGGAVYRPFVWRIP
jgi:hypothetical protein